MLLTFKVESVPVAQPRARSRKFGGVYNPTKIKRKDGTYKPHPIVAYKEAVRDAAALAMDGRAELTVPLVVDFEFIFPRPDRLKKKKSPKDRIPLASKPDRDNLDKAALDAMKGIVFKDDCQAWSGRVSKVYAAIGEEPHVAVQISFKEERPS